MRVKPAPGLKVRHPVTRELHDETTPFDIDPNDLFWAKLLELRDVVPAKADDTPEAA